MENAPKVPQEQPEHESNELVEQCRTLVEEIKGGAHTFFSNEGAKNKNIATLVGLARELAKENKDFETILTEAFKETLEGSTHTLDSSERWTDQVILEAFEVYFTKHPQS